ncbi:DUF1643 domain-containing protein [Bacillus mangrovi]|uniref:DUF1643 domain-containing protein n=1 Tax=Metabacillus mangrovi TaxID=1491830 RepID=A0A7X2S794_9BACI|nr:DUF1643 domain-containing protein [Metabacillus mangrovi]MTH54939.1 DUF1643 domain-containing protein [Metabacillus mangrovi]
MDKPVAYGTFVKKGNETYRTSAYLQWGDSTESLGACLLLNPGSSKGVLDGKITIDPTMNQLISFIHRIREESQERSGRLHIYNLFNLQEASSEKAIIKFENLVSSGEYDLEESLASAEELKEHPWILLGWGVKYKSKWKNLNESKRKWMEQITESNIPYFGKAHPKRNDYYHPCPRISTQRSLLIEDFVRHYKQSFRASPM